MNIVQISEKEIRGISVRTNNADEMRSDTAKIGKLYQQFDETVEVNYKAGARVYGVYFNYESDVNGAFSVLAGSDQTESSTQELETVSVPAGQYMVFEGKGEMPQIVIETWAKVWNYFSNDDTQHKRAYRVDFEHYRNANEIAIYVSIE